MHLFADNKLFLFASNMGLLNLKKEIFANNKLLLFGINKSVRLFNNELICPTYFSFSHLSAKS